MFCNKCGNKSDEGAGFCSKCGTKFVVINERLQKPELSEQDTAPPAENAMHTTYESVQLNASKTSIACTVRFLPKKIFGQWMVRKATIIANGKECTTKFRKPIDFEISSGHQTLTGFMNYMGRAGKFSITYNFEPEKKYLIKYRTPLLVFFDGKVKIEEIQI